MADVDLNALTPAGRRVLDAAAELFYRQGINAVGVEAIATRAEVTKKTLYACFGSKDQLVTAYLVERDQLWRSYLASRVDECDGSAVDKLLSVFTALASWMDRPDFRGCGFVNAHAEIPSADHPARRVIEQQKQWMVEYFRTLAGHARATDPDGLARSAFLLFEGVTVATSTGLPDAAEHAKRTIVSLLS
jgi:AcrR family transcriptional regulator